LEIIPLIVGQHVRTSAAMIVVINGQGHEGCRPSRIRIVNSSNAEGNGNLKDDGPRENEKGLAADISCMLKLHRADPGGNGANDMFCLVASHFSGVIDGCVSFLTSYSVSAGGKGKAIEWRSTMADGKIGRTIR